LSSRATRSFSSSPTFAISKVISISFVGLTSSAAGSSIYKLGEAEGSSVYLEMYGGYQKDMSLADFNAKQSVVEAKSIFESVKIGL